jgi:hypothetical protein
VTLAHVPSKNAARARTHDEQFACKLRRWFSGIAELMFTKFDIAIDAGRFELTLP